MGREDLGVKWENTDAWMPEGCRGCSVKKNR